MLRLSGKLKVHSHLNSLISFPGYSRQWRSPQVTVESGFYQKEPPFFFFFFLNKILWTYLFIYFHSNFLNTENWGGNSFGTKKQHFRNALWKYSIKYVKIVAEESTNNNNSYSVLLTLPHLRWRIIDIHTSWTFPSI